MDNRNMDTELTNTFMDTSGLLGSMSTNIKALIPTNISLQGIPDLKTIATLFSPMVDDIIDKAMDLFEAGNFEGLLGIVQNAGNVLNKTGIGKGAFQGDIPQRILRSIEGTMSSIKFNKTKSKIFKILMVIKRIKKESKFIRDPELKEKYKAAVKSLISLGKFINSVYKNRKYITGKMLKGLGTMVREDVSLDTATEIEF